MEIELANESDFKFLNLSLDIDIKIENEIKYLESLLVLSQSGKVNIFSIVIITLIGLIGNFLTIMVFSQKKFRINSSSVYLLCLAINDSLFLIIHLVEDTMKTFKDMYLNESELTNELNLFALMDQFEIACRFINYMRNVLRFISAYIVVLFTIQRLAIVYHPLSRKFISIKSAWKTVLMITIVSILINIWVPFMFEIEISENKSFCDIKKYFKREYFYLNIIYTTFIMLIPMLIILLCNLSIIYKTVINESKRKELQLIGFKQPSTLRKKTNANLKVVVEQKEEKRPSYSIVKPHYMTENQLIKNRTKISKNSSKKMTIMLLFISFSFLFLNLPYFISWMMCFYEASLQKLEFKQKSYLYAALQISEIFYVLNYGIKFFIYCTSSTLFNNQLKKSTSK